MSTFSQKSGFTIVELLIVIVVIGILAAITIVAYNGIQNRAKSSSVQSVVTTITKKAKLYYTATGQYPTLAQLQNNTATDSTVTNSGPEEARVDSTTVGNAQATATNGTKYVRYAYDSTSCGASTGFWIDWWDYDNNRYTSGSTTPSSVHVCAP